MSQAIAMTVSFRKAAIFVHRWLGVALCLLFLLWFSSGVVMMYWGFPSVTAQDRLERSPRHWMRRKSGSRLRMRTRN